MKILEKHRFAGALAATVICSLASNANAATTLTNPSFELGEYNDLFNLGAEQLQIGSTKIQDWTVVSGIVARVFRPPPSGFLGVEGSFFLDLQGGLFLPVGSDPRPGGVTQTFDSTPGQQYRLNFYLGVSGGFDSVVRLSVTAGATSQDFVVVPVSIDPYWLEFGIDFTATSTATPITFSGRNSGSFIGLDAVSLTAVPEATVTTILIAFGAFTGLHRRTRFLPSNKSRSI